MFSFQQEVGAEQIGHGRRKALPRPPRKEGAILSISQLLHYCTIILTCQEKSSNLYHIDKLKREKEVVL